MCGKKIKKRPGYNPGRVGNLSRADIFSYRNALRLDGYAPAPLPATAAFAASPFLSSSFCPPMNPIRRYVRRAMRLPPFSLRA